MSRAASVVLVALSLSLFLGSETGPVGLATYPGYNGKIAFVRNVSGDIFNPNAELLVMNADGSGTVQLTFTSSSEYSPDWSPDGTTILYTCGAGLCVMNADGTGQTTLPMSGGDPAWSPDGNKIAFFADRGEGGGNDIYTMDADGTNLTRITSDPLNDIAPAWSPDGASIAFARGPYAGTHNLWVTTGGVEEQIGNMSVRAPAWSPDGTKIAYHTSVCGPISIVDLDGNILGPTIDGHTATWSPDGAKIAFVRVLDVCGLYSYQRDIFVANANGSGATNVTNAAQSSNIYPAWQSLAGVGGASALTEVALSPSRSTMAIRWLLGGSLAGLALLIAWRAGLRATERGIESAP